MRHACVLLGCWLSVSACHLTPSLKASGPGSHDTVSTWEQYRQCRAAQDPDQLLKLIERFPIADHPVIEPPGWMKAWSPHVENQPRRESVNPQAVLMACTIKAANLLIAQHRTAEAKALYLSLLSGRHEVELTYYISKAREALAALPPTDPTVIAARTVTTVPAR